jgi:hypothetical protein
MIKRIWHGWTSQSNADAYERLLMDDIFPSIIARQVHGLMGIELLRREYVSEEEFVTIMTFQDLTAVRQFAGDDFEAAYVPDAARRLLDRFEERSRHYHVRINLEGRHARGDSPNGEEAQADSIPPSERLTGAQ